jgi:hypothetical protein
MIIRILAALALIAAGYAIAQIIDPARAGPTTGAYPHHHIDRQPSLRSQS